MNNDDFNNNVNNLNKWNVRTDLAYDEVTRNKDYDMPDFFESYEEISKVPVYKNIIGTNASKVLNKQKGTYYTLDLSKIDFHDATLCENVESALSKVLIRLLINLNLKNKKCLLVGLGNINVTPDALGPYVMDNVIVTRHLFKMGRISEGFSEVSAISPGVMGNTGIETFDIIKSINDNIKADFLIVVDALASSSIARVNKTIQITDTGISPGSGVGNRRKELSISTMGVPVIAIGVPTVVDAVTITSDAIDLVVRYLSKESSGKRKKESIENHEPTEETKELLMGQIGLLTDEEKKNLIKEVLTPNGYNMMVTPKEVDSDIEDLSKIISTSIDLALHHGLLIDRGE